MTFPPENFETLRLVPYQIKHGELELPIGKKILKALFFMIENPERVAVSNIVQISKMLEISPASITRLAKLLGFRGFAAFHNIFKQTDTEPNHFYSKRLKGLLFNRANDTQTFLQEQANASCRALHDAVAKMDMNAFDEAAKLIITQHRVYLFGHRQPASLASIFRYGLTMLRGNVHMLSQAEHGVALAMRQVRREDLLVLISATPYSDVTLKIANQAKNTGCKLLAITDSSASPLTERADVSIVIPATENFYINSQVLNCFFVENLLNHVASMLGQTAMDNLLQYEQMVSKFQIST